MGILTAGFGYFFDLMHGIRKQVVPLLLVMSAAVYAAPAPELLVRVKEATAYLETDAFGGTGTAFCISAQGHFLTCAHVIGSRDVGAEVKLTLRAGTADAKEVKAKILRIEQEGDLAVLKVEGEKLEALPIGKTEDMKELNDVLVVGYPLGRVLQTGQSAPAVTLTTGKVTALRKGQGGTWVDVLQMDAELNPGNSGGPVIDNRGRVVGVAAAKVVATRLNFAVGTTWINAMLATPRIVPGPLPKITAEKKSMPMKLELELDYLKPPAQEPKIAASFLMQGGGQERPIDVTKVGQGHYVISGVPVPPGQAARGQKLRIECFGGDEDVRTRYTRTVQDREITVGRTKVWLSQLSLLEPLARKIIAADGRKLEGSIGGLDQLISLGEGEYKEVFNANPFPRVMIRPLGVTEEVVTCRVTITNGDSSKTLTWDFPIEGGRSNAMSYGNPEIPAFAYSPQQRPSFESDRMDLNTGGEIKRLTWGGGGRYVVVHQPSERRLRVIDCVEGKIRGDIPVEEENPVFGAGGRELFLVKEGMISRWDLDTLKPVSSSQEWVQGKIIGLGMGTCWTSQIFILYEMLGDPDWRAFELRDVSNGKVLAIEPKTLRLNQETTIAVAGAATVAAVSSRSGGLSRLDLVKGELCVKPDVMTSRSAFDVSGGWLLGEEGRVCIAGFEEKRSERDELGPLAPTTVSGLAMRLRHEKTEWNKDEVKAPLLDLIDLDRSRIISRSVVQLDELRVKVERDFFSVNDPLRLHERICFAPQLGVLATVSRDNVTVCLRKMDLKKTLKSQGANYTFVTAVVPELLPAGKAFEIDLGVISSQEKPSVELVSGPLGMTVSEEGVLRWNAPERDVNGMVIVRVKGEGDAERLWRHTFFVR